MEEKATLFQPIVFCNVEKMPEGSCVAVQNILLHKALLKDTGKDCTFADGKGLKEVQYKNAQNSPSYMI